MGRTTAENKPGFTSYTRISSTTSKPMYALHDSDEEGAEIEATYLRVGVTKGLRRSYGIIIQYENEGAADLRKKVPKTRQIQ
jgi:hypothetical protein